MSGNMSKPKDLGIAERIFLAFTKAGQIRPICQLVTYPNKDAAPSPQNLRARITQLGEIYPILTARFDDSDPAHPHHESTGKLPEVHEWEFTPSGKGGENAHELMDEVYKNTSSLDTLKGPLMRIDYVTIASSQRIFIATEEDNKRFFQLLLAAKRPDLKKEGMYDTSIEELTDFVPPPGPPPPEKDVWPLNVPRPMDVPGRHAYFDYPVALINKLKSCAKDHGVQTLNPVLTMASMASLIAIAPTTTEFNLNTLRNERKACGNQAPLWSSNYFGSIPTPFEPATSADFWQVTQALAEAVKSPASIQGGRYNLGGLVHVPIPLEQALSAKMLSEHPYIASVSVTNMTHIELPPGSEDFRWTSAPTAVLSAVLVHWVGHEGGLRMSVAYRDGAGITLLQAEKMGERVGFVLDRLANGESGSFEAVARE